MKNPKNVKVTFAPGCFDNFNGTQEELDELIADIQRMIESGEIFEKSNPVDIDDLLESDDPEDQLLAEKLLQSFNPESPKNLQ